MPDGVLPALLVLMVVWESVHDKLVDSVERDLPVRSVFDSHGDESDVAVRRFLWLLSLLHISEHLQSVSVVLKVHVRVV